MNIKKTLTSFATLLTMLSFASCDGEKDLIIIDQDLPIKADNLYMVGNATPAGWAIATPTELFPTDEDALVFTWKGNLQEGEMKLCTQTGSWDAQFIRPINDKTEIGKYAIVDASFSIWAGDPDNKWNVVDEGLYELTFDLRHRKMSTTWLGEIDDSDRKPIETENLYLIGDATPSAWDINNPEKMTKTADYTFEWEGVLYAGNLQALTTVGDWGQAFMLPKAKESKITKAGLTSDRFTTSVNHNKMWEIVDAGVYKLTFDLKEWTLSAEYKGEFVQDKLYMIGSATEGGWSFIHATEISLANGSNTSYEWTGYLSEGDFKAGPTKNSEGNFYRPAENGVEVSESGVANTTMVLSKEPDHQWKVVKAGNYKLLFDTQNMSFTAQFLSDPGHRPVDASELYIFGDATTAGWDINNPMVLTKKSDNVFVYEGNLFKGALQATLWKGDWAVPFFVPQTNGCKITKQGVESNAILYLSAHDNMWQVDESGSYRLTFDLNNFTITAQYIDGDVVEPVYLVGGATPGGWDLDKATEMTSVKGKAGEYVWTGNLSKGEMKACSVKDYDNAPFYRPKSDGVSISKSGVSNSEMEFSLSPDRKWNITDAGEYEITLNTFEMTITGEYLGATQVGALYLIGDAVPSQWDINNPTAMKKTSDGVFTYEGELSAGSFQALTTPGNWGAEFIVPLKSESLPVDKELSSKFEYNADHSNMWTVVTAGKYRLTFNLSTNTMTSTKLN